MQIIHQNPYRVAGVLAGASERELTKQKNKIKAFAKVGKAASFEVDYSFMPEVDRGEEAIGGAFSAIEQGADRVISAMWWLVKGNSFDEMALGHLKEGDLDKALEILGKVTNGKSVSETNYTSFNNYGTLAMLSSSEETVKTGIEAKVKLIESAYYTNFVELVADKTVSIDRDGQIKAWMDTLTGPKGNAKLQDKIPRLTAGLSEASRGFVTSKFTDEPIHNIEQRIAKSKTVRKESPQDTYDTGVALFNDSLDDMLALKGMLDEKGLKYQAATDGLANEIMQCGIDYFKHFKEEKDVSEETMQLLNYASRLAIGPQTKDRVKENIGGVEEWKENGPIEGQVEKITQLLTIATQGNQTLSGASTLVNSARPYLDEMAGNVGRDHVGYVKWSTLVSQVAMSIIIGAINAAQEGIQHNREKLNRLPDRAKHGLRVLKNIGTLDMDAEARSRHTANTSSLRGLSQQIDNAMAQANGGDGCYVATMAYGDYDHPQVLRLRHFRDAHLRRFAAGRAFIRTYYRYSPGLVSRLGNQAGINAAVRRLLDWGIATFGR